MAKATLHLWHTLKQCYKNSTPLIKNTTLQKWRLTTYIIGFLKYYQLPANRTYPFTIRHTRVIIISIRGGKTRF